MRTGKVAALAVVLLSTASAATPLRTNRQPDAAAILVTEGTISSIQSALRQRRVSCVEIVTAYLERIARLDRMRGLNAITTLNPEALQDAARLDEALRTGHSLGSLFCVPVLVKDNIDTRGLATTGGSMAMLHNVPQEDAFIVRNLHAAGAIVLAKTNMAEWAFSPRDTVSSSRGVTTNAYDQTRTPAGSSGGTAAGIAASFGLVGLGTDTGNSVRGPSAYAALVGLRPTLGLVSRGGIIPLELDRDTAGPITRTVEDNARLLNVLARRDPADPLTADPAYRRPPDYTKFLRADALNGARIGVVRALAPPAETDPQVLASFNGAIESLRQGGAIIVDPVTIPNLEAHLDNGYYCARFAFDANTYLRSAGHPGAPRDIRAIFAAGSYSPHSKSDFERFLKGSAANPQDAKPGCPLYLAHPGRRAMLHDLEWAMDAARVDVLVYPTWLNLPPRLEAAVVAYRGDNSQLLSPPTGMPAITLPCGFAQGLPIGLQWLGRRFDEGRLYGLAYAFEQRTHWRRPPAGFEPVRAE
ncbi:MAG: amidase [Steroidobacteraceae bacterium]